MPTDAHWNAQSIQEHKRERDVVVQDIQTIVTLHLEIIHKESTAFVNIKAGDIQWMDTHAKSSEEGTYSNWRVQTNDVLYNELSTIARLSPMEHCEGLGAY